MRLIPENNGAEVWRATYDYYIMQDKKMFQ
jgi:hypothetical protein